MDFETTPTYTLSVSATDQSPISSLSTICTVDIIVTDSNDNAPIFDNTLYDATIIENATNGELVTRVSADDLDSGTNGQFSYSFQTPISKWACQWVWH